MAADGGSASLGSSARDANTASLVRRLVRATLTKHGAGATPDADVDRLFRYAVRLVGSSLSASVEPDEGAAADAIRRRLARAGADPSAVVDFSDLHRRLSQQPGLRKRWALLHALLRVAESKDADDDRAVAASAGTTSALLARPLSSAATSGGLPAGALAPTDDDDASSSRRMGGSDRRHHHRRRSDHHRSLADGDGSTLGLDHPGARELARRELEAESVAALEVPESELVRDVLFACQGIDGRCLAFDPAADAFVVRPEMRHRVSPGAEQLARTLAELGWLFKRVRASLGLDQGREGPLGAGSGDDGERPNTAAAPLLAAASSGIAHSEPSQGPKGLGSSFGDAERGGGGRTRRAFRAAAQAELSDYYRLIAVLEAQAQVPMAAALEKTGGRTDGPAGFEDGGSFYPPDGDGSGSAASGGASSSYLTLRRLAVWLAEPTRRLRTLAAVADAVAGLEGGALLRALHALSRHGDPAHHATVSRLYASAATPLARMTEAWVVSGEAEDARGEFFVAVDLSAPEEDMWRSRYGLDESMRPPFIDRELALDVLRVGKSINFLRRCCDDDGWAKERDAVVLVADAAEAEAREQAKLGGDADAARTAHLAPRLRALAHEAKRRVDAHLLRVVFDRYKFGAHCLAAKRYLLLGQGDFHAFLMDLVGRDLDEPADAQSAYRLAGVLEQAVRASNAQFEDPEVLDRLRVRVTPHAGGEQSGWDVFSLEYAASAPLTTVFTAEAAKKYLRAFTFLWRLKRVEHALCATWQTMKPNVTAALQRDGASGAAGRALAHELRRCHTLRGEMHHFVSNLQYYVMFEVLEASWERFRREMREARDLDHLIAAHDRYLDTILQKSLLGPKSQLLARTLGSLFESVLRFRGFADRLYEVARDAAMRRQLAQLRVEKRREAGGNEWGTVPGEDAAGGDGLLSERFVDEMREQLDAVGRDYAETLDGFLNLLPLQTHADLKFLEFRLDFSEFYGEKQRAREGDEGGESF